MEGQKQKRVSLLGPMLLIGVGIILLLNTLGILEWSIWWTLLSLWPVFLIAAGLDLLLGRHSIWGSLLAAVLVLAIVAGALWVSGTGIAGGRGLPTEEISQPLDGATQAAVIISPGVGVLRIEALPESANLVEGVVHLDESERLVKDYSKNGGQATLALRAEGTSWVPFVGGPDMGRVWALGLSPGAVLEAKTDLGLGEADLDLTNLTLSNLEVNMGLGLTEVTLPAEGRYQARIDGAIGATTIVLPEGLAARIHVGTGLATRQMPDGYQQDGDVYTSPGYQTAEDRVELDVNQAIGILRIRHSD